MGGFQGEREFWWEGVWFPGGGRLQRVFFEVEQGLSRESVQMGGSLD